MWMKTISLSFFLASYFSSLPFSLPPPSLSLSRVEAIYPVPNPHNMHDSRVASLFQYAVKVEKMMFENASSRVSPESWAWSL